MTRRDQKIILILTFWFLKFIDRLFQRVSVSNNCILEFNWLKKKKPASLHQTVAACLWESIQFPSRALTYTAQKPGVIDSVNNWWETYLKPVFYKLISVAMRILATTYWKVWMGGDIVTSAIANIQASTSPLIILLIKLVSSVHCDALVLKGKQIK